jgi:GntR family transcriptional repressor for pyruvate dehydrogenase complex
MEEAVRMKEAAKAEAANGDSSPGNGSGVIERISKQDLHLETTSRLAQLVASSQPGSRLPTERELGLQLGVGRSTLREAIRALSFIGAVRVRQGSGTYVSSVGDGRVERLISLGLMLQRARAHEIIAARQILEVQAVRMAAHHHDAADREALESIMRHMADSAADPPEASRYDLQFHVRLAQASHNSVLVHFINGMRALLEIWINKAVTRRPVIEEIIGEHNAILDAVFAGDADLAAARMTVHLTNAAERLFSVVGKDQPAADFISLLLAPARREQETNRDSVAAERAKAQGQP